MNPAIQNSTINFNANHNEHSQKAIESVARALEVNALALQTLASSIKVDLSNSCAIKITEGNGEDY